MNDQEKENAKRGFLTFFFFVNNDNKGKRQARGIMREGSVVSTLLWPRSALRQNF